MAIHYIAALFLVGIPALLGSFWLGRDFGRTDPTTGVLVFLYSVVIAIILIFVLNDGYLTGIQSVGRKSIPVWIACALIGTMAGLKKRKDRDSG